MILLLLYLVGIYLCSFAMGYFFKAIVLLQAHKKYLFETGEYITVLEKEGRKTEKRILNAYVNGRMAGSDWLLDNMRVPFQPKEKRTS